ncbi:MAG: DUF4149 domain-containing protein [Acidiphilium sp.]
MARFLAIIGLAALTGGMIFFAAVMAPLVFGTLPPHIAGTFIRAAFPRYYLYMIATSAIGALGLLLDRKPRAAAATLALAAVTAWLWLAWLPHLDTLHAAGHNAAFATGHTISVWIDAAQLIAAIALLMRAAGRGK